MNIVFLVICAAIIIPLALWSERNIRRKPEPPEPPATMTILSFRHLYSQVPALQNLQIVSA